MLRTGYANPLRIYEVEMLLKRREARSEKREARSEKEEGRAMDF
jgi:hypothetical protein